MNGIHFVCGSVLCHCLIASAGTNPPPIAAVFSVPALRLRTVDPETNEDPGALAGAPDGESASQTAIALASSDFTVVSLTQASTPSPDQFSLSARVSELEMQVYRRLDEGGYLSRPESETGLWRFMERAFSPEVIHIGRATAACTLYTAIKRKNPLCLLNPLVLFVSW